MLIEIFCDEFKTNGRNGQIRPAIKFHEGLNTILGTNESSNSIGKSTFLAIIDYVFGGTYYSGSVAAKQIGEHTIKFAFSFDEKKYFFSRVSPDNGKVNICNADYVPQKSVSLDEFTALLSKLYQLPTTGTFRSMVSRFSRVYGKKNTNELEVLAGFIKEPLMKGIIALENLFGEYAKILPYKKTLERKRDENEFVNAGTRLGFFLYAIRNKKQYDQVAKQITELQKEQNSLKDKMDEEVSAADLKNGSKVSKLKARISTIKTEKSRWESQARLLQYNIDKEFLYTQRDLKELQTFFPSVNLKKLNEIELFHKNIQSILKKEFWEQLNYVNSMIKETESEIHNLQSKIRALGKPATISEKYLKDYSKLDQEIIVLTKQKEAYDHKKKIKKDLRTADDNYAKIQTNALATISNKVNSECIKLTDFITSNITQSPILTLDSPTHYSFYTPNDDGTGTSYRGLITFDLSVLKQSALPFIIHDSLLFKNIEDEYVNQIIRLYSQSKKQIFIAFDGTNKYAPKTQEILKNTSVLELGPNGNQLFGYAWNQKE